LRFSELSVSPKLVVLNIASLFKEETDVCHSIPVVRALQQAIPNNCTAKTLGPGERMNLGVQAIAGHQTVTGLAGVAGVSRKFVSRQAGIAQAALDEAFASTKPDDEVLRYLPITKNWLKQAALGLTLICHSSQRGVHEFYRDLLGVNLSVGTVHNIVHEAIDKARPLNLSQNLANVDIAGLDEIFQKRRPVLVGADIPSTYCFLLSDEEQRDGDTWAIRLLECQDRGFAPKATIADFGTGIRAGQQRAMPNVPCRGDVFHALHEITPVVAFLENRAYDTIAAHDKLERKKTQMQQQARRDQQGQLQSLSHKIAALAKEQAKAIPLADDVAVLARWLRADIFAVSALPYDDRGALFDFVVAELQARVTLCPQRLNPVCTLLKNHRDQLLAFAWQLDQDLIDLAADFKVPLAIVREMLDVQTLDKRRPHRWQKEAALRHRLGSRFHPLEQAVRGLSKQVVRASSIIENLNSRLRNYFFLRREIGSGYLELLQFFLNHRRFLRSECPERVHKSPAELLTGEAHLHWLEMLGYSRSCQN
jgi:hypothetical protein